MWRAGPGLIGGFGTRGGAGLATVLLVFRVKPLPTVLAAFALLASLAACGSDANLAKVHHSRTTIPAADDGKGGGTPEGKPVNPAFAPDKLRKMDPCQVIDAEPLVADLGEAGAPTAVGYDECAVTLRKDGKTASVRVELGINMLLESKRLNHDVGGLKADRAESQTYCDHKIMVQEGAYSLGVGVSLRSDAANRCELSAKAGAAVINKIKGNPPARAAESGALAQLDPCTVLDQVALAEVLTNVPANFPWRLHQCSWRRSDGQQLKLEFAVATNPKEAKGSTKPEEVKVDDGLTVYKKFSNSSYPRCEILWPYRSTEGTKAEVVSAEVSDVPNTPGYDACGKAISVIKALKAKLPKT